MKATTGLTLVPRTWNCPTCLTSWVTIPSSSGRTVKWPDTSTCPAKMTSASMVSSLLVTSKLAAWNSTKANQSRPPKAVYRIIIRSDRSEWPEWRPIRRYPGSACNSGPLDWTDHGLVFKNVVKIFWKYQISHGEQCSQEGWQLYSLRHHFQRDVSQPRRLGHDAIYEAVNRAQLSMKQCVETRPRVLQQHIPHFWFWSSK